MFAFTVAAFFLIALALAFVLWPLLGDLPSKNRVTRRESNLAILRQERDELSAEIEQGRLQGAQAEEALQELTQTAKQDLVVHETHTQAEPRRVKLALGLLLILPATAFGLYAMFGSPQALDASAVAAVVAKAKAQNSAQEAGQVAQQGGEANQSNPAMDDQQIVAMVEALKAKMAQDPTDPKGWQLLARSLAAMGRYQESADAYEKLVAIVPSNAQFFADYADVLGVVNNMNLSGKPNELIEKALKLDPKNQKALALSATAALNSGQFDRSIELWKRVKAALPAGSEDIAQVDAVIADVQARAKGGNPSAASAGMETAQKAQPQPPVKSAPATQQTANSVANSVANSNSNITGNVTLSDDVKKNLSTEQLKTATLFILARASGPGASRMPLAVMKVPATQLPTKFKLDDSMAMAPGANLSSATVVAVEARISFSGNAIPQPGDWFGVVEPIQPGAQDLQISINQKK